MPQVEAEEKNEDLETLFNPKTANDDLGDLPLSKEQRDAIEEGIKKDDLFSGLDVAYSHRHSDIVGTSEAEKRYGRILETKFEGVDFNSFSVMQPSVVGLTDMERHAELSAYQSAVMKRLSNLKVAPQQPEAAAFRPAPLPRDRQVPHPYPISQAYRTLILASPLSRAPVVAEPKRDFADFQPRPIPLVDLSKAKVPPVPVNLPNLPATPADLSQQPVPRPFPTPNPTPEEPPASPAPTPAPFPELTPT
jgi:hypothetical protein